MSATFQSSSPASGADRLRPSARRGLWAALAAAGLAACGPKPPADHAPAPEPTTAEDAPPATEAGVGATTSGATTETAGDPPVAPAATDGTEPAAAAGEDELDADIAALAESTKGAELDADSSRREIIYRVTPKGLVIEIDGLHLHPEAKPFKDQHGAYGVELIVKAESFDGRQYWVNKPKEGPLSIAGKIETKDGKPSRFLDQREGKSEELVHASEPRTFRQRWPGRGQPKLWWGQTVTLEVGLWGFRSDSGRERPVRRLFVVKMVAGNKPQAIVSPPTLDWGS